MADDLDRAFEDVLNAIQDSSTADTVAVTNISSNEAEASSLGAEFDELFGSLLSQASPTHVVTTSERADVAPSSMAVDSRTSGESHDEFLSWLSQDHTPGDLATTNSGVTPSPSSIQLDTHTSDTVQELEKLLDSSIVDVESVRALCMRIGNIPHHLRAYAWGYLLQGHVGQDAEAEKWRYTREVWRDALELGLHDADLMEKDCLALERKAVEQEGAEAEGLSSTLSDLVSLYLARRNTPYACVYVTSLAPLLSPPHAMSRSTASACGYAFCTQFLPFFGLRTHTNTHVRAGEFNACVMFTHAYTRLLLGYHFPKLMQHFDRVLPDWEIPTLDSKAHSAGKLDDANRLAQMSQAADELERRMGGAPPDLVPFGERFEGSSPPCQLTHPGLIPVPWTCAMFTGCLPSEQMLQLWDWCVCVGNKHMGVYLTVSLLGMYEDALCSLTGEGIQQWIAAVTSGLPDWHRNLAWSNDEKFNDGEITVGAFVRAWIRCTAYVCDRTPYSFQNALDNMVVWAQECTKRALDQNSGSDVIRSKFIQDKDVERMCMWTSAEEVVPQLCSPSSVRTLQQPSFHQTLLDSLVEPSSGPYPAISLVSSLAQTSPARHPPRPLLFFGVDCRCIGFSSVKSVDLMSLGRFPTAFVCDGDGAGYEWVTDSDKVYQLMQTFEPLKDTVHVCLIGPGEGLLQAAVGDDPTGISRMRPQVEAHLHSMALLFIKQKFRYVSILEGGLSAALEFLMHGASLQSVRSLIDADLRSIHLALGLEAQSDPNTPTPSPVPERNKILGGLFHKPKLGVTQGVINTFATIRKFSAANFKSPTASARSTTAEEKKLNSTPVQQEIRVESPRVAPTFVIDGEDEDAEDQVSSITPSNLSDEVESTNVSVSRSEAEKQYALAQHRLSGLQKNDSLVISKENLPGAILFPAIKYKEIGEGDSTQTVQRHRFLVVTPERLIVLDSGGGGVGAAARVKSNHHLTELAKVSFKKRDPDLVSVYFRVGPALPAEPVSPRVPASPRSPRGGRPPPTPPPQPQLKIRQYRISKRQEFVELLQRNMARYK